MLFLKNKGKSPISPWLVSSPKFESLQFICEGKEKEMEWIQKGIYFTLFESLIKRNEISTRECLFLFIPS